MFPTFYNQRFPGPGPNFNNNSLSNSQMDSGIPDINVSGMPQFRIPDPPVIEKKGQGFNWITYVLIFFLLVFFVVIIILLFVNTTTKSKYVKPENCPSVKSNYASIPSVSSTTLSTVTACSGNPDGYQGSQPCSFGNISTLYDAQNLCNKYQSSICNGFSYNPSTLQLNFIKTGYSITSNLPGGTSVDVYLKQDT